MICPNCGKEVADNSAFCDQCGTPLAATQAAADAAAAVESLDTQVEVPVVPVEPTVQLESQPTQVVAPDTTVVQAPAAQAIPQPTTQTTATTGTVPAPTQVMPQAAPQQTYNQQQGYAAPQTQYVPAQPVKQGIPMVAKVAAGVLAAVLAVAGLSRFIGGSNNTTELTTPVETTQPSTTTEQPSTTTEQQSTTTEQQSTETTTTQQQETTTASFPAEALDANGKPTIYSCIELSGAELNALCQQQGFVWKDSSEGWVMPDNSGFVGVSYPGQSLTQSEIETLPAGGGGSPIYYVLWMSGYSSAQDAVNGLGNVVVEDSVYPDDELGLAIVYGPSMKEYLVLCMLMDDGDYAVSIFSQEGLAEGAFTKIAGDDYGTTINDIWVNLTGTNPNT